MSGRLSRPRWPPNRRARPPVTPSATPPRPHAPLALPVHPTSAAPGPGAATTSTARQPTVRIRRQQSTVVSRTSHARSRHRHRLPARILPKIKIIPSSIKVSSPDTVLKFYVHILFGYNSYYRIPSVTYLRIYRTSACVSPESVRAF